MMAIEETYDTYWLFCPYCRHAHHQDCLYDCPRNRNFVHECAGCGKEFDALIETHESYSGKPIWEEAEREVTRAC